MISYHCERCGHEGPADHVNCAEGTTDEVCHQCNFGDALVPMHEWKWGAEARANSREARKVRLFKWGVITATILGTVLYIAAWVAVVEEAKGAELPRPVSLTLPQQCAQYSREYDESEWDEATHSYPRNHEWESCMGVGAR